MTGQAGRWPLRLRHGTSLPAKPRILAGPIRPPAFARYCDVRHCEAAVDNARARERRASSREVKMTSRHARNAGSETTMFAHYGVEPRARTMALQEPQVTVRVREVGTGEPVLLLHGITLGAVHWAPLIARMSSLRCIALDMPGHGGTSSVDFDGMDLRLWHVAMLRSCLDGLGLRSAHIVGHSYGGMFGLWLALDGPERVRSLITIGTPSIAFGARPDAMFKMLALRWVGRSILTMPS